MYVYIYIYSNLLLRPCGFGGVHVRLEGTALDYSSFLGQEGEVSQQAVRGAQTVRAGRKTPAAAKFQDLALMKFSRVR